MITAVDTNILLDVLIHDKDHYQNSKELLDEQLEKGQLVMSEIVYAELASQFPSEKELRSFFTDTGIKLIPSGEKALYAAGERWKQYAKNRDRKIQCPHCGSKMTITCSKCKQSVQSRQHIVSDFIIAAHALFHAEVLLTRDRGFYRTYFMDLKLIG